MKKWVKNSLYVLSTGALISFICIFAIPFNKIKTISCVGSSGVKPFVEEYAKEFLKTNKVDVNVDAGGSGFGISQVANNFTNIGTTSKNPFNTVKESYRNEWINNNIKTVTIGWEGICIVYIQKKKISNNVNLNQVLTLNQDNITNLYRTFSGFKNGLPSEKPHLSLFLNPNYQDQISKTDLTKFENQTITPYARSGGSLTSGTAASFFECCHFDNCQDNLNSDQIKAFENGNYGNDFKLYDTDEANSRAWSVFNSNNIPGSMIYLSSSFVEQNRKLIETNRYGILSYNNIEYQTNKIGDGYNFFRPLNLLLNINSSSKTKEFVESILNYSLSIGFLKLGAQGISQDQYNSMLSNSSLWISDNALLKIRGDNWDSKEAIFGAVE